MTEHLLDNLGAAKLPAEFCSAEGALLWDTDGRGYWDFYGGHAVTLIGQAHPKWIEAIERQARQLAFFTTLGGVPVRRRAAEKLCTFTGMDVAFFVNSGAEANEAALKIARKSAGRSVIVAFEKGFHGRTTGALGATWKYRDQHSPAHGPTRFVPFGDLEALRHALGPDVAAVIVEPVQGIAGVVEPPKGFLREVAILAREAGALLIADEIQCGMGRMGVPLVSKAEGVDADLVTIGKGLAGGFPAAACLMRRAIAQTVAPGEHGTTFGGAPLACAAIEVTLDILTEEGMLERACEVGETLRQALGGIDGVVGLRGKGAWIGVELDRPAGPVHRALFERGWLVGTSSDPCVLRLAPPAVMPLWACHHLADALAEVLASARHAAA
ncbi:MAG: aspartate aminotransferase family protein [Deltaproteobacteria bacterium]|nr:MAG: aspartate aminotransferase family protein [Deltaproteobacteria bacterium]